MFKFKIQLSLSLFTINCHLVVNYLTPFHFLSKQLTPSTSSIQLGLTLFLKFLGFQLPLGLTLLTLLRLPLP